MYISLLGPAREGGRAGNIDFPGLDRNAVMQLYQCREDLDPKTQPQPQGGRVVRIQALMPLEPLAQGVVSRVGPLKHQHLLHVAVFVAEMCDVMQPSLMLGVLVAQSVAEINGHLPGESSKISAYPLDEVQTQLGMMLIAQLSLDDKVAVVARAPMNIRE